MVDPSKKVPDLKCKVTDLLLEVVDLKQEVPHLRSGGIPLNLTSAFACFMQHKSETCGVRRRATLPVVGAGGFVSRRRRRRAEVFVGHSQAVGVAADGRRRAVEHVRDAQSPQQVRVERVDHAAEVHVVDDLGRAVVAPASARRPRRQDVVELLQTGRLVVDVDVVAVTDHHCRFSRW